MEKERKSTLISVVLYSLCSLIVGGVVGGTLLMKILTQDEPSSAPETVRAELIETTDTTTVTTTTTSVAPEPIPDTDTLRSLVDKQPVNGKRVQGQIFLPVRENGIIVPPSPGELKQSEQDPGRDEQNAA